MAGVGRGRVIGSELKWHRFPMATKILEKRDICVTKNRKLALLESYCIGRGRLTAVYMQMITDQNNNDNNNKDDRRVCLAVKSTRKLLENLKLISSPRGETLNLNDFPDRLLKLIFSYLQDVKTVSTCERICRRWRTLLYANPNMNPLYACLSYDRPRTRVKHLSYSCAANVESFECTFDKCRSKESFDYYRVTYYIPLGDHVTAERLKEFVRYTFTKCVATHSLTFQCLTITKHLLDDLMKFKQDRFASLRLFRCNIQSDALKQLEGHSELKHFAVDECLSVDDSICNRYVLPVIKKCRINKLELCSSPEHQLICVDDKLIDQILSKWHQQKLTFLKLSNCPNVTTEAIIRLVEKFIVNHENLKTLTIFLANTGFDVDTFAARMKNFKRDNTVLSEKRICFKFYSMIFVWVENVCT